MQYSRRLSSLQCSFMSRQSGSQAHLDSVLGSYLAGCSGQDDALCFLMLGASCILSMRHQKEVFLELHGAVMCHACQVILLYYSPYTRTASLTSSSRFLLLHCRLDNKSLGSTSRTFILMLIHALTGDPLCLPIGPKRAIGLPCSRAI